MAKRFTEGRSDVTWEAFARTLQDARWVAQGIEPGDNGESVQLALWWNDGIIAEYGDERPYAPRRGFGSP